MENDVKALRFYYKMRPIAETLQNKKLINELVWFIATTEKNITSNFKFSQKLGLELGMWEEGGMQYE